MFVLFHGMTWPHLLGLALNLIAGGFILAFLIAIVIRAFVMFFEDGVYTDKNRHHFIHDTRIKEKVEKGTINIDKVFDRYYSVKKVREYFDRLSYRAKRKSLHEVRDTYLDVMDDDENKFKDVMTLVMLYRFKDGYELKRENFDNTVLIFENRHDRPTSWSHIYKDYDCKYLVVQEIKPKLASDDIKYDLDVLNIEFEFTNELPARYQQLLKDIQTTKDEAVEAAKSDDKLQDA